MAKIGIIILNYNGDRFLKRCLKSVFALGYSDREVFVVDNDSKDGSLSIAERFPDVRIIRNDRNLGFAGGMNVGIRAALQNGAEFLWLLNNDAVVSPNSLQYLVELLKKDPKVGAASPLIYFPNGKVWFSGGDIDFFRMRTTHRRDIPKKDAFETEYLTGCALFLRRKALEEVGLLDERFFLYYEDADLSVRLKEKGWKLLVEPKSLVFHEEASTRNPEKIFHLVLSGLLFFEKHSKGLVRLWFRMYSFLRKRYNKATILFFGTRRKEATRVSHAFEAYERRSWEKASLLNYLREL